MARLVGAPISHAGFLHCRYPHRFADWPVSGPALKRTRVLDNCCIRQKCVYLLRFQGFHGRPEQLHAASPCCGLRCLSFTAGGLSHCASHQHLFTQPVNIAPVHSANCIMLRAWPKRAPSTACCSSGLKGSTSSSRGGASFLEYVQPARGLISISSSSEASLRAERRQLWMLLNVLLPICKVSSQSRISVQT